MLFMMGISFFTTRITLKALGIEDLGIYNIVGGVIVLFDFISSGLTNSTQRYLNIAIGKNDNKLTNNYFSQSLVIHLLFSVLIIVIGETIGLWFMTTQLNIPENRYDIAFWVYQFSIISVVLNMLRIPYNSAIIAYEKMTYFAYLGIIESVFRLIIAYVVLKNHSIDKLFLYSILMLILPLLLNYAYYRYCIIKFSTCKFNFIWDKELIYDMVRFIGYNAFGCIAWAIGIKGIDFLLNIFFNPIVNGSRALAMTLSAAVQKFNDNIFTATKPQLIKSYAAGEYTSLSVLSDRVTKYSFYLLLIIGFPILSNTKYILSLWLGEVPIYTVEFTQLAIIESWIAVLPNAAITIINASGKIKGIQVYARIITLLSIPLSYILLKYYDLNVYIPIYVSIISKIFYWIYCITISNKLVSINMKEHFHNVIYPIIKVILIFCSVTYIASLFSIESNFVRLIISSFFICSLGVIGILLTGISVNERLLIFNYLRHKKL